MNPILERFASVKSKCLELLRSISDLKENENPKNQSIFNSKLILARDAIFHMLELPLIDASIDKNLRKALKLLTIDVGLLKDEDYEIMRIRSSEINKAFELVLNVNGLVYDSEKLLHHPVLKD